MKSTEYFAVIDDEGRRGPFSTMQEASLVLKEVSRSRGHNDEEARQFFLHDSAVVKVEDLHGRLEFFNIGWQAREESGREEIFPDAQY